MKRKQPDKPRKLLLAMKGRENRRFTKCFHGWGKHIVAVEWDWPIYLWLVFILLCLLVSCDGCPSHVMKDSLPYLSLCKPNCTPLRLLNKTVWASLRESTGLSNTALLAHCSHKTITLSISIYIGLSILYYKNSIQTAVRHSWGGMKRLPERILYTVTVFIQEIQPSPVFTINIIYLSIGVNLINNS